MSTPRTGLIFWVSGATPTAFYPMAFLLIYHGEPASRWEEVAYAVSQLLGFELITESRIEGWIADEFQDSSVPDRAWPSAVVSILARMAADHRLVVALPDPNCCFGHFDGATGPRRVAPETRRIGTVMIDRRLERPAARELLVQLEAEAEASPEGAIWLGGSAQAGVRSDGECGASQPGADRRNRAIRGGGARPDGGRAAAGLGRRAASIPDSTRISRATVSLPPDTPTSRNRPSSTRANNYSRIFWIFTVSSGI